VVVVTSVTSVALTGGACGGASTDTGGLMLLIRSDMTVGTDFDSIRVEVAAEVTC